MEVQNAYKTVEYTWTIEYKDAANLATVAFVMNQVGPRIEVNFTHPAQQYTVHILGTHKYGPSANSTAPVLFKRTAKGWEQDADLLSSLALLVCREGTDNAVAAAIKQLLWIATPEAVCALTSTGKLASSLAKLPLSTLRPPMLTLSPAVR